MISAAETLARLRLSRSENVGPITYRQLMQRFGSGEAALAALPDLAARGGKKQITLCPPAEAKRELDAINRVGAMLLILDVAPYPSLLAQIEDAPPVLIAKGHATLFDRRSVAMVGARNASAAGIRFARELAVGLAQNDLCVVSGLARGIDTAAHEGAMAVPGGGTIACVAGGIDVTYPPENAHLYGRIAETSLLLSEQPLGTVPQGRHFPRRNRLISGLSLGTVVIEAALKSGSLITARVAAEQGREVMAVPGSPADPRAQGCNQLVREGATLVQSVADILEVLTPLSRFGNSEPSQDFLPFPTGLSDPSPNERQTIHNFLGPTPVPIDELVRLSGLPGAMVQLIVLEMELAGLLTRHAGGRVSLAG
jgi:DNA processing protein